MMHFFSLFCDVFVRCRSVSMDARLACVFKSFMMSHFSDFFTLHCFYISDSQALLCIFMCFSRYTFRCFRCFQFIHNFKVYESRSLSGENWTYLLLRCLFPKSCGCMKASSHSSFFFFILCGCTVVIGLLVSSSKTPASLESAFHIFTWIHS